MNRKRGRRLLVAGIIAATSGLSAGIGAATSAYAVTPTVLSLTYSDPVADQTGPVDVSGMTMTWDQGKKNYTVTLTADPNHPFTGQFRVVLNMYDPTAPSKDTFFRRTCRKCDSFSPSQNKGVDFDLGTATQTSLTFTGRNKVLKFWAAGDEVATNSWASLGNPPGVSLFRSSVSGWPAGFFTNEDGIGLDDTTCNSFGCTFGSSYAKAPIVAS
jgi:hypothetical protein